MQMPSPARMLLYALATLVALLHAPGLAGQQPAGTGPMLTKEETLNYMNRRFGQLVGAGWVVPPEWSALPERVYQQRSFSNRRVNVERFTYQAANLSLDEIGRLVVQTQVRNTYWESGPGQPVEGHVYNDLSPTTYPINPCLITEIEPFGPWTLNGTDYNGQPRSRTVELNGLEVLRIRLSAPADAYATLPVPTSDPTNAVRFRNALLHLRDLCRAEQQDDPFAPKP